MYILDVLVQCPRKGGMWSILPNMSGKFARR